MFGNLMKHHQAAFINSIAEEGTKEEVVRYLQETWNELCEAKKKIRELEFFIENNQLKEKANVK